MAYTFQRYHNEHFTCRRSTLRKSNSTLYFLKQEFILLFFVYNVSTVLYRTLIIRIIIYNVMNNEFII